jgi:cell division septation protein DedD
VVLHLSSLRSEAAAKREWSDLQHSFPHPLGGMAAEFHRTELGEKGTFYRVLAGPLPSRDKAREVCAELKAKDAKQYCRILPSKPKAS